ncbi:MAG TPA: hypothetical protein PKM88_09035, partial [bacterium]|nr:hypothetical protein [bacterium]
MTTNAALQDILERQAETIAHAGEQLAEAMTGSTCGVTVVRGLRRDMGRMKEQVQALVSQQWAGAGRHPGRPGWMVRNLVCDLLTRPESESPAARTLLLADTLAELGSCVEELALTLRLRQCGTNFSSAAVYLADALRTLGILVRAARTGALPAQECALLQEYLRRLHEQHWQLLADAG